MPDPKSYTCENCGGTFENGWSDEEAQAEYRQLFPNATPDDAQVVVCEVCFEKIIAWAKAEGMLQ